MLHRLIVTLIAQFAIAFVGSVAFAQQVSVELSMARDAFRQGEPLQVTYTIKNQEARPVSVLKWNTPLEGLIGNPFVVQQAGAERPYYGVMVARLAPSAKDWAVIPANGSVSAAVDLAQGYDVSAAGDYEVRIRQGLQHVTFDTDPKLPLGKLRTRKLTSNALNFRMLDAGTPPTISRKKSASNAIGSFVGCSAAQQNSLNVAFADMSVEASTAWTLVGSWDCNAWANNQPAKSFMGAVCTAPALSQVQNVTRQVPQFAQSNVILDCTGTNSCAPGASPCTQSNPNGTVLAFTCGGGPNSTVYVCPGPFFGLTPLNSVPSQESTLYHELTHWAHTGDYAYGCQNCGNLAASNPAQAQNNADSYTYFAAFLTSGASVSCGVEHFALTGLVIALVQIGARRSLRRRQAR